MTIHDYANTVKTFVSIVIFVLGLIAICFPQRFVDKSESKLVKNIGLVFIFFSIDLFLSAMLHNIA